MKFWTSIIFLSLHIMLSPDQVSSSTCVSRKTCQDCIQLPDCAWCLESSGLRSVHCWNSSYTNTDCYSQVSVKNRNDTQLNVCPCKEQPEENSFLCHENGSWQCGVCYCNPGYSGKFCHCLTPSDHEALSEYESTCKATNESRKCSGRGTCVCGKCECDQSENPNENYVYGLFCECDDFSCDRDANGTLCGNSSLQCRCGICLEPEILEVVQMSAVHTSILRSIKQLDRK